MHGVAVAVAVSDRRPESVASYEAANAMVTRFETGDCDTELVDQPVSVVRQIRRRNYDHPRRK